MLQYGSTENSLDIKHKWELEMNITNSHLFVLGFFQKHFLYLQCLQYCRISFFFCSSFSLLINVCVTDLDSEAPPPLLTCSSSSHQHCTTVKSQTCVAPVLLIHSDVQEQLHSTICWISFTSVYCFYLPGQALMFCLKYVAERNKIYRLDRVY